MTVKELKEELNKFDDNLEIWVQEEDIYFHNSWFCSAPFTAQSKCEKLFVNYNRLVLSGENFD